MRCSTPLPSARQLSRKVSTSSAPARTAKIHHAHQPVTSETIAQADGQALHPARFDQVADLDLRAPPGAEVHLVSAPGKLRDARESLRFHGADANIELQPREKIL